MDRRAFLGTLGLLAVPLGAEGQSTQIYRIGLVIGASDAFVAPYIEIFRHGRTPPAHKAEHAVDLDTGLRYADGHYERLPALAADLVRLNVDIVVTEGTPPIFASGSDGFCQSWFDVRFFLRRSSRANAWRVGVLMPDAAASRVRNS